jgi:hypothetical protein
MFSYMLTPDQINEMSIEELKVNFLLSMSEIVTEYGDDQQSVSCPGQTDLPVVLPGGNDQSQPVKCA